MIEFVTLLLGLVTGVQAVEVSVGAGVARVELRLDGELAGSVDRAPWFVNCDFGTELSPHELVAAAYDAGGNELGSVRQWVNLPRRRAEAHLILDRATAPRSARLIWTALDSTHPPAAILSLDGKRLELDDLEAIELPPYDPRSLHLLRAELLFPGAERLSTELVFGGSEAGEETWSELTAVPMLADKRPPKAEEMDGWTEKRGRPLRVVAVDSGPVDLVVVRERSWAVQAGLELNHDRYLYERSNSRHPPVDVRVLDDDDRVRFVFPTTGRDRVDLGHGLVRQGTEQVPVSRPLRVKRRHDVRPPLEGEQLAELPSLFEILCNAFYGDFESPAPVQELADAVAIAGLTATAGDQRRAVILILSGDSADSSRLTAAQVRGYLDKLRVPLFVWSITAPGGSGDEDEESAERIAAALAPWGPARDVSSRKTMNEALDELRKALRSQVLVWLEGAHLAHEVELTEKAAGLRPVVDERTAPEPPVLDPKTRVADQEPSAPAAPAGVRIGPYPLETALDDGRLTAMLDRAAAGHRRLYAERYGVAVEGPIAGRVVLLAAEREYLELKRLQGHERDETEAAGYFEPPSLVVLQRGSHTRQEVTASLLHELTHLLNWRLLGGAGERDLPAWLEEGLAGDLALSSFGRQGLAAEPLGPGNLAYGRRLGAVLLQIDGKLDEGAAPSVEELLSLDRAAFLVEGSLHYALAALWVRYLLDGELAAPFRAYLAAVAAGGDAGPEALRSQLGRDWTRLEQGFRSWLDRQVRRIGP